MQTAPRQFRMTTKQQRICDLVTRGMTSKEIGREVGLSRRTVEDHRSEIFKKVGVRNAVELTRKILGASHELLGGRTDGIHDGAPCPQGD